MVNNLFELKGYIKKKNPKKGRRENPSILTFDTVNYNSINFTFDGILLKKISILIFKKKF